MKQNLIKLMFSLPRDFSVILFVLSLLGYLNKFDFIFDVFCHFRLQYLLFGLILLTIYVIFQKLPKRNAMILILLFTIITNLHTVLTNRDFSKYTGYKNTNSITIGHINIMTSNMAYGKVINEIKINNPDILFLEETSAAWAQQLEILHKTYPYRFHNINREDNFGMSLYSKYPLKHTHVEYFSDLLVPAIYAEVNINGNNIELAGIHTPPPVNSSYYEARNQMLLDVAKNVKIFSIPTIVVGDINTSIYSHVYKNFLNESGLKNSSNRTYPTWNAAFFAPLRIQLDYIFVPKDFHLHYFRTGSNVESDHLPIYLKLSF